jgi:hypothetical protein
MGHCQGMIFNNVARGLRWWHYEARTFLKKAHGNQPFVVKICLKSAHIEQSRGTAQKADSRDERIGKKLHT